MKLKSSLLLACILALFVSVPEAQAIRYRQPLVQKKTTGLKRDSELSSASGRKSKALRPSTTIGRNPLRVFNLRPHKG